MIVDLPPVDPATVRAIRAKRGFGTAVRETVRVVSAMVAREANVRYGDSRLGYLWAFVEPALFFVIFLSIRTLIADRVPFGESAVVFLLAGIIAFRAFRSIQTRMMTAITGAKALMTFPVVTPFDAVIARGAIETLTMSTVIVVFYTLVLSTTETVEFHDPVDFTGAMLALTILAFGTGCFSAVMVVLVPTFRIVVALSGLPLLILSGIFYVPASLPPEYLAILEWNPVLHCVEWFRDAVYLDYTVTLDRSYPIQFGLIAFGLGLIMSQVFRVRVME